MPVQSPVPTESKDVKPRLGQDVTGIQKKIPNVLCLDHVINKNNQNYCQDDGQS